MVFDHIEQLKREYTDKYVVVDDSRPELARFRGVTGVVKTVNMSGRALVEFDNYLANIGWYDIELDFLHVVPKPEPGAVVAHGEKPALAKAVPGSTAPAKTVPATAVTAKPAAAKPAAASKAAPAKAGGKAGTADVLAALRAGKGAAAPAKPAATTPAVESTSEASEEETTPEPPSIVEGEVEESITTTAEPPASAPMKGVGKAGAAKGSAGGLDAGKLGSKTLKAPADQIAYCRLVDTKS